MQEIYTEFLQKVLKNKKKIESELNVKITNKGKNLFIKGPAEAEFTATQIIEAINLGFSVDRALLLKDEKMNFQILNIKNITKRKNLEEIRGRIIGTHGRTLKTLNKLTDCFISLNNNKVGIIGYYDSIEEAIMGLTTLIQGSKQGKVYGKLERENKRKRIRGKIDLYEDIK